MDSSKIRPSPVPYGMLLPPVTCHLLSKCHLLAYPPPPPKGDDVIYVQPLRLYIVSWSLLFMMGKSGVLVIYHLTVNYSVYLSNKGAASEFPFLFSLFFIFPHFFCNLRPPLTTKLLINLKVEGISVTRSNCQTIVQLTHTYLMSAYAKISLSLCVVLYLGLKSS